MGYTVSRLRNTLIFFFIIGIVIFIYNFMPVYKCKNVDRNSERDVNDIYIYDRYYNNK